MNKKIIKGIIIGAGFLIAGILFSCARTGSLAANESVLSREDASETSEYELETQSTTEQTVETTIIETTAEVKILVHICGEVVSPGVYEFNSGSRVYDAINAAGGFSESADETLLNLAQVIHDGEKIYVPQKGEKIKAEECIDAGTAIVNAAGEGYISTGVADDKVNINTATAEELKTLNGIGDSRAADIIAYREANGPFEKIEDIMKISGIKTALFTKIKDRIRV